MRNIKRISVFVILACSLAATAIATSPRVFMSQTGNDSNDCSNPLTPCVDFAGAVAQVAVDGEVIALTSGPYGPLSITKGLTISGPNGVVLYTHQQVLVDAPGARVVIRGMTIDGSSNHGVAIIGAASVFVENCVINASTGDGIFVGNGVTTDLVLQGTTIRNGNSDGILVFPGGTGLTVNRCHIDKNAAHGLEIQTGHVTLRESTITGNGFSGIVTFNPGTEAVIERCLLSQNGTGASAAGGGTLVRISNSSIIHNSTGLFNSGGSMVSRSNNTLIDNILDTSGTVTSFAPQ